MMEDWWKTTFKETYLSAFEPLYSERRTRKEVDFLVSVLRSKKKDPILDVPCGAGRHSIELARRGFTNITGIDFSRTLLHSAEARARSMNLPVRFHRDDVRHLRLKRRYKDALVLGNSFGYFSDVDNERFIGNIARCLKRGGHLLLDLPNSVGMMRHLEARQRVAIPQGSVLAENSSFDPLTLRINLQWTVLQRRKRTILSGTLRLYTFPEMNLILQQHGFQVKKLFGSLHGGSYSIDTPRMVTLATLTG